MLPTFFVIGAAKAGTTALYHYLGQHPEVHMSPIKEPSFFARYGRVTSREEYELLFESDAAVRGEASPAYSLHPRVIGAPERMHALVPDAKLIYLVRDPIERTLAHYLQRAASQGDTRPIEEALGDVSDPHNRYTCASRYATQLEQYLPHFSLSSMLVVDQADLRERRSRTLSEIFSFLLVDPLFSSPEFESEPNPSKDKRAYGGRAARLRSRLASSGAARAVPPAFRAPAARLARRALSRPLAPPVLAPARREELAAVLGGEAERLRALTGKSFPSWSV